MSSIDAESFPNAIEIFDSTPSTSSIGSFMTYGGITIYTTSNTVSLTQGGSITTLGGVSISRDILLGGNQRVLSTIDSTDTSTGALIVDGGGAFKKSLNVAKAFDVSSSISGTPSTQGQYITIQSSTFTDNDTVDSGTAAVAIFNSIASPILAAASSSVTTTDAATLYIAGEPFAGTNQTITNSHPLWVGSGISRFDNQIRITNSPGSIAGSDITNGHILVGTSISGVGIDLNEIYRQGSGSFVIGTINTGAALSLRTGSIARFNITDSEIVSIEPMRVSDVTESTDKDTGALIVEGGVGIEKNLNVGGGAIIYSTIDSTNTSTGALVVDGGGAFKKSLNVAKAFDVSSLISGTPSTQGQYITIQSSTFTDNATTSGQTIANMVFNSIDAPTLSALASSITTNEAATLYIAGGPIQGTNQTISNSYALYANGDVKFSGDIDVSSNTQSTSASNGSINTLGGLGVALDLNVDGTASIGNTQLVYTTVQNILATSITSGSLHVGSLHTLVGTFGNMLVETTTNSTNTSSGSIITRGGVGIQKELNVAGPFNISGFKQGTASTSGQYINIIPSEYRDSSTVAGGTAANMTFNTIDAPTLSATNANVYTNNASTLYIKGGPLAGINETINKSYALRVGGNALFEGEALFVSGYLDASTRDTYISDIKPIGTNGGTFLKNAWRIRDLNTISTTSNGISNLAGNILTIQKGVYRLYAVANCYNVKQNQCRLYNITDSTVAAYGTTVHAEKGEGSTMRAKLIIPSTKTMRLEHYCDTDENDRGFGLALGAANEIYSTLHFEKVQD